MVGPGLALPEAPSREPEFGHDALVVCDNLVRIYQTESVEVQALQGLDLLVHDGEMLAIVGASGSGKSTLLQVLAGVDAPTAGRASVAGHELVDMSRSERVRYRRHVVGFVRQQSARNLVPYLTASQVVDLPMTIAGTGRQERRERTGALLETLGVAHCADRRPQQMSGGEQQRVAIAVALANRPRVLLADEPTGELDSETAQEVFAALRTANRDLGATVVIVTHDAAVSDQVARTVAIRDGRTSSEVLRTGETADAPGSAEEYAVMDRAGRVQVPREFREALALTRRVRLALAGDHVEIRSDRGEDA
ncbi:ATP-binding cassette domain-containing protein [Nocardioides lijunqiniae]|uniref:ATP-binding cassette domain-containing protein n=1 Tax=Nocardioides lijunqiniae TaxID=2760832 RepID=UPI0018778CD5|nr:ATP-binding cassette domain-containing protein [Nocardioides lijunqiniae]